MSPETLPADGGGTSLWTMLAAALIAALVTSIPTIFARIRARAALAARQDELELERLNREEQARKEAEERARLHEAVKDLTSQIRAVTAAQEASMPAPSEPPHDPEAR